MSFPVVRLLGEGGHDIVTSRELDLDRVTDDLLLLAATERERLVVTSNERDFVLLHRAWWRLSGRWEIRERHAGIIVLPQSQQWPSARTVTEIESILGKPSYSDPEESIKGRLWLWRRGREWFEVTVD